MNMLNRNFIRSVKIHTMLKISFLFEKSISFYVILFILQNGKILLLGKFINHDF